MEQSLRKGLLLTGAACACLIGLNGCSTPQPRDFTGAWHPVNRFAAAPERVELRQPYLFRATPLDATLKGMLTRWAGDARLRLDYRLPYDLTLHQSVESLRSERIADAVAALDRLFAAQQIAVTLTEDRIVVAARAGVAIADPSPAVPGADRPGNEGASGQGVE